MSVCIVPLLFGRPELNSVRCDSNVLHSSIYVDRTIFETILRIYFQGNTDLSDFHGADRVAVGRCGSHPRCAKDNQAALAGVLINLLSNGNLWLHKFKRCYSLRE